MPDGHHAPLSVPSQTPSGAEPDRHDDVAAMARDDNAIMVALTQHAHAARGAFAANTERALRADTAVFIDWCSASGLAPLPALPAAVAAFVDAMDEAKAPATIRRYVSSIASMHRAARLPNPCADEVVRLALKRLHRTRGRAQAQATPLTRDLVDRMLTAADARPTRPAQPRDPGRGL